jgi:enoyl-CoA hydratase/carnithine racemase
VFSLPPARLGLAYPLDGLSDLVSAVGAPAAKEMILTARKFTAEDAFRIGLIDRLASDIETEARALAAEIAAGAPLTITHAKKAIDFLAKRPGHEDDAEVAWLAARCFDSEDYAEGRTAFMEKRSPLFRGS